MPTVSIIMGVYNCKSREQLFDSVQSIIEQTFTDWEFIICNDGSTNNTAEMLEEIAKLDDRIKIIGYDKNQGLSYALNTCIAASSGEYIARQDDDDISYTTRLMDQVDFLNRNKEYQIVGCIAETFDHEGDKGIYSVPEIPGVKDFRWICPFIHPTVMMRVGALKVVNCYKVSKDTMRGQDYDLFMRMYGEKFKGYNIQKVLYRYRLVNGGYKKRPLKIRISEAKIRAKGFWKMGIFWSSLPYIFKPVILSFIPLNLLNKIRSFGKNGR